MIEYFLHFWGAAEEAIAADIGTAQKVFYFPTQAEREAFERRIRKHEHLGLVVDRKGGEMRHKRTVAVIVFEYDGHKYVYNYDFGPEYEEESARYMFESGNYSCDCNRSHFLTEIDPDFPPLDCGNQIKMLEMVVRFLD